MNTALKTELRTRRCVRHSEREAAARCPGCGGFFCRECVAEYRGRLLCRACLERETASTATASSRWRSVRFALTVAAAFVLVWAGFYTLGVVALRIPDDVHNGSFWKNLANGLE